MPRRLLLISCDALTGAEGSALLARPEISFFSRRMSASFDVSSVPVTNTYPVHTCVVTGVTPEFHGIRSNLRPLPEPGQPPWNWFFKDIRVKTLYTSAREAGLRTGAVFWPVTAGAPIDYNLPEILPWKPRQNQVFVSLCWGSPLLTAGLAFRYKGPKGPAQPALDDFACFAACDIVRRKKPSLMLVHFTDVDSHKHRCGTGSPEISAAFDRMARRTARLLRAAGDEYDVILFSDHGMKDFHTAVELNRLLAQDGFTVASSFPLRPGEAWAECCGGTAFIFGNGESAAQAADYAAGLPVRPDSGVGRLLSRAELDAAGYGDASAGVEARPGYIFAPAPTDEKAEHGYSVNRPDYKVFYAFAGPSFCSGISLSGGTLLDIAPAAAHVLGLSGFSPPTPSMKALLKSE